MADVTRAGSQPADEMPIDYATVLNVIQHRFADAIDAGLVDLLPAEGDDRLDIVLAGDEWSICLTTWPGPYLAFIALEDEPDDDADSATLDAAWREAVPEGVVEGLRSANADLGGAIAGAMERSRDPLTLSLRAAIGPHPPS